MLQTFSAGSRCVKSQDPIRKHRKIHKKSSGIGLLSTALDSVREQSKSKDNLPAIANNDSENTTHDDSKNASSNNDDSTPVTRLAAARLAQKVRVV